MSRIWSPPIFHAEGNFLELGRVAAYCAVPVMARAAPPQPVRLRTLLFRIFPFLFAVVFLGVRVLASVFYYLCSTIEGFPINFCFLHACMQGGGEGHTGEEGRGVVKPPAA